MDPDAARAAAVAEAATLVDPAMALGLGSGRAVFALARVLGARYPGMCVAVASDRTAEIALAAGLDVRAPHELGRLDLALDGADEIDPALNLLKGGGAALLREKLLVEQADRFVCCAERSKLVTRLGERMPLPVEVVSFGWRATRARLLELVPSAELRREPARTDEGHRILDCALPAVGDLGELARALKLVTGVVEHGLFLGLAERVILGSDDGSVLTRSGGA